MRVLNLRCIKKYIHELPAKRYKNDMTHHADDWAAPWSKPCMIAAVMATVLSISIPLELGAHTFETVPPLFVALRWAGYLVFIVEFIVLARNGVFSHRPIYQTLTDVLTALPVGPLIYYVWPSTPEFVINLAYMLPMIRLFRVYSLLRYWQHAKPIITGRLRLSMTLLMITLIIHWIGCSLLAVYEYDVGASLSLRYIQSVYWAITTMTTVGYGDITPDKQQPVELLFTMLVMIIGAGSFGFIIGNIATIMANRDYARTQHLDKMQRVSAFMGHHRIPNTLREKVLGYHSYLWQTRQGYDEAFVLNELPPSIRSDLEMHLRRDIVKNAPMFKEAESDMIREVVSKLKPHIALPNEIIMRKGEVGESMFFIGSGTVDVIVDGDEPAATLNKGSCFGEIAVLNRCARNATVRAHSYCDLYELIKDDLDSIGERYPDFMAHISKLAEERMGEKQ